MSRLVLGLDPGLAAIGWALIRREGQRCTLVAHGTLTTTPEDGADLARVAKLDAELSALLALHGPDVVATEAWVEVYAGKGADTTAAHLLGLVVGMIGAVCRAMGVHHVEGERAQGWRTALGLRRTATKAECQERVRAVLGLAKVIRPQHASDAAAVAIVAAQRGSDRAVADGLRREMV